MTLTFASREVFARLFALIISVNSHRTNACKQRSRNAQNHALLLALAVCLLSALSGCGSSPGTVSPVARVSSTEETIPISVFDCKSNSALGAATDTCTVFLTTVSSKAASINLSSNNPAVVVPSSVTVPENASSVQFTADLASVGTTQTAILTASTVANSKPLQLTLFGAVSTLLLETPTVALGYVPLNSTASQPVYLLSTGTIPVTISAANISGASFKLSGATFPIALAPGQKVTIEVAFSPTVVGAATGEITFVSNSSTGTKITSLSATGGPPPISVFDCKSSSALGAATDACTIFLTTATSKALAVNLSSNNPAVVVPAAVSVPANAAIVQFTANLASVGTTQTAVLTASTVANSKPFQLTLFGAVSTLLLETPSVAFGYVPLNTTVSQPINLLSTGTVPLTISAANISGTGFRLSGATFPMTLARGQTATIEVQFSPLVAADATGQITFISNSSTGSQTTSLTAIGSPVGKFPGSPVVGTLVPPDPASVILNDFFGMTIYWLASQTPSTATGLTPFPSYPISTLRLWDVDYWANIEYREGADDWVKMDGDIAAGQQNGVQDFLFTFGQPPNWASTNPTDPCTNGEGPGTCSPPDQTAYDAFATKVVQRYCGKVKYYEPWNEPNNLLFWDGTNAQMLTIAQHLYSIAKDPANCGCTDGTCSPNGGVNPNKVLLPPIAGVDPTAVAWLDAYLASANLANPYADVASFHGYVYHGFQPEEIATYVPNLRQTLAKYGLSNLELWNTEASFEKDTYFNAEQQASWLMRSYTTEAALGITRFIWYAYDDCTWGTLWISPLCSTNTVPANQLTQAGSAYGVVENWLVGASITQCQQYQSGLWACELQRPNNYDAWMLWSSNGTTFSVAVPASLGLTTYRNSQNGVNALSTEVTVSDLPVLLE